MKGVNTMNANLCIGLGFAALAVTIIVLAYYLDELTTQLQDLKYRVWRLELHESTRDANEDAAVRTDNPGTAFTYTDDCEW